MRKEILSSVCTLSLVLGASSAFAGAYGDVEQPEEIPAPPPAVAVVEPEPETDYARTGPYIGVGGLYAIEFFSQGDAAGNKQYGDASNSGGFHVAAGYRVIPNLAIEARYEHYFEFDTDPQGTAQAHGGGYNGWSGTVNAKGYILTGQWQPYALIGLGYLSTDARRNTSANTATANNGDGFAMRFGVGMDACIGEHWALGPEIAYLLPFGDASNMDMLTIGAGVRYKF